MLFLAERLSATPYIYAYDLNPDAALGGSWIPTGLRPNGPEADRIRALHREHVEDFTARVSKALPAAFVFFDKSPLISNESALVDFTEQCRKVAALVNEHYVETAAFGEIHVHLRKDCERRVGRRVTCARRGRGCCGLPPATLRQRCSTVWGFSRLVSNLGVAWFVLNARPCDAPSPSSFRSSCSLAVVHSNTRSPLEAKAPGADAKVVADVKKDQNQTLLEVEVKNLPPPERVADGSSAFVAWYRKGSSAQWARLASLKYDKDD